MSYARQVQAQCFLLFCCDRIVETNTLNKAAIATIARIGNDYVVKRTILGTATGKTNDDHIKPI